MALGVTHFEVKLAVNVCEEGVAWKLAWDVTPAWVIIQQDAIMSFVIQFWEG